MTDEEMLSQAWTQREAIYLELFGDLGDGIYPVQLSTYTDVLGVTPDPRWLHAGVFASAPDDKHNSWLYVTSGLSTPWGVDDVNPDGASAIGMEFVLETVEKADWPVILLHRLMAFQSLLSIGHFPGKSCLTVGDRVPLRQSVTPDGKSPIEWVYIDTHPQFSDFTLPSGNVRFLSITGLTNAERDAWIAQPDEPDIEKLRSPQVYPMLNPYRTSEVG
jgi:hypothetical protein